MDIQILIGLIVTVLPIFELRGGLPIIVEYVVENGLSVWPYFFLVLALNVLVVFLIFLFFDFVHSVLMRWRWYEIVVNRVLSRARKKTKRVEDKMNRWGYFALAFFVAVPLPGSGAWTGGLVAWVLGLDRVKSFFAIAVGVLIAGLIILGFSFGFFSWFY